MIGARLSLRTPRDAGFTLLELLAVLVIIGFTAAVALPKVGHVLAATAIHSAAGVLASELRTARIDAISMSTPHTVTIDPRTRFFRTDLGKARQLPNGVDVLASTGSAVPSAERASIVFAPDGSSSGGQILLGTGKTKARVVVDWMTGAAQVEWGS